MTVAQKQWLVGRLETQALYGTRVRVIGRWRSWVRVTVPSQPTDRDARGYPGWVPAAQLTATAPSTAKASAVVIAPTARLWSHWAAGAVSGTVEMLASYDTRLPVIRATAGYVVVALVDGRRAAIRRADVTLHAAGASWDPTRAGLLAGARRFLDLPYLWAGTSGFGFDCSGFTYALYHAQGIVISRDADQQAVHGEFVLKGALQPGDLVFFRGSAAGRISHVGIYVGSGKMIDAPHTGGSIRVESLAGFSYYAGARRYLTR